MEAGPGRFYSINPATGAGTLLGGSLFVNNGGMAWDPLDDDYWLIDWSGRLYRYEPTNVAVQNIVLSYLSPYAGLAYVEDPPF
jgi:sugar lactone lactonase YvrE